MPKIALLTNPSHDISTEYMESWSEKLVLTPFRVKDFIELKKINVTKANLINSLTKENPKLIIFNAHGDKKTIAGYNKHPLIENGVDEHLLKDKIVHTLACSAGHTLGPSLINNGTIAYIGYKENFKAACFNNKTKYGQQNDPLAKLSFVPAFAAADELLKGKTVGEAYEISRKLYLESLRKASTHPDVRFNQFGVTRLIHNLRNQVCLGNRSVKL